MNPENTNQPQIGTNQLNQSGAQNINVSQTDSNEEKVENVNVNTVSNMASENTNQSTGSGVVTNTSGAGVNTNINVNAQSVVSTSDVSNEIKNESTNAQNSANLVAPSNVEQTIITDSVSGMSADENNGVEVVNDNGNVVNNVDSGIREEVKLDTTIIAGVPNVGNANFSVTTPVPEKSEDEKERTIVETKKKKNSNAIVVVLLIIMIVCIIFIDDIMEYFNTSFVPNISTEKKEESLSNNLVDGYIKIGDLSAYIKLSGVKFYNFSLKENNKVIFSFVSDDKLDSSDKLGYYIVLFNSDKELLYKEQFKTIGKIEGNSVNQYVISVDALVYQEAKYAQVIKLTDEEIANEYNVVCSYTKELKDNANNVIKMNFKNTYYFKNDLLESYSVSKEYVFPLNETDDMLKYKEEIDNENASLISDGIKTDYNNYKLNYTVVLSKVSSDFIPLYKSDATKTIIVKKEKLKKWECK